MLRDARAVLFTSEEERRLARDGLRPWKSRDIVIPYGTLAPGGDPHAQIESFLDLVPACRGRHYLVFLGKSILKRAAIFL